MFRLLTIGIEREVLISLFLESYPITVIPARTLEEAEQTIISHSPDVVCIAPPDSCSSTELTSMTNWTSSCTGKVPILFVIDRPEERLRISSELPDTVRYAFTSLTDIRQTAHRFVTSFLSFMKNNLPPQTREQGRIGVQAECLADFQSFPAYQSDKMFIGRSEAAESVREQIMKYAPCSENILIHGESGTGKELVATLLHHYSGRSGRLVAINSSALPRELVEAELFGYEKGAFTGADSARKGIFEQADGGTLFLDEIGDLDMALQPKLLRILEERKVRRIGGTKEYPFSARTVSATNVLLKDDAYRHRLRSDLLYRLCVFSIFIPPLRSRKEDIIDLAEWFLSRYSRNFHLSSRSRSILTSFSWPGNVRQLFSTLKKGVLAAETASPARELIELEEYMLYPIRSRSRQYEFPVV